jgi:hypothetical protein
MSIDQGIGLTGIVLSVMGILISIIIAAFITTTVKKRRQTQRQSVGERSVGIQSGRDTRIER